MCRYMYAMFKLSHLNTYWNSASSLDTLIIILIYVATYVRMYRCSDVGVDLNYA